MPRVNNQNLTWVEINRANIGHNIAQYRRILNKKAQIMAIVKSNAYGHGMIETGRLAAKYCEWLGVANLAEALELRAAGIENPILVLSYYTLDETYIREAILKDISLVVYDIDTARFLSFIAQKLNKEVLVHAKVDTGTSRLGVLNGKALTFIKKVKQLPQVEIEGIFSHFAASEEDQKFTQKQLENFNEVLENLEKKEIEINFRHFACSAAALVKKEAHFDLMRLGISMYGLWPSEETKKIILKEYPRFKLKPALSWKTRIVQVKDIPKRSYVGYGCTYKTKRKTKLAVLPIGYWEGYDRHLSNKGEVLVKGKRCPVLGRVCMNLSMIDVTDVPAVKVGDEAVLTGKQGREEVTADELAQKIGTINYEVVTRINPLIARIYK